MRLGCVDPGEVACGTGPQVVEANGGCSLALLLWASGQVTVGRRFSTFSLACWATEKT